MTLCYVCSVACVAALHVLHVLHVLQCCIVTCCMTVLHVCSVACVAIMQCCMHRDVDQTSPTKPLSPGCAISSSKLL